MSTPAKSIATATLAALFVYQFTAAQAPEAPTPGPGHQRLGYFVGEWKGEGKMQTGPESSVPMTSVDKCEWFEGKFAVICRSEGTGPMGPLKSLSISGYNAEENVYTLYAVDNTGMVMTSVPQGSVKGDTWTYTMEATMGGNAMKSRSIIKEISPTAYTFAMEMQGPDGEWHRFIELKYTKVK